MHPSRRPPTHTDMYTYVNKSETQARNLNVGQPTDKLQLHWQVINASPQLTDRQF